MSLGPILIFDKSTLQSLNVDEAVWLDNFFMTNITPLFFIETLADLEKEVRKGKTPEQVVGEIAYKIPDMSPRSNVHHMALAGGELLGKGKIEMRGFPILGQSATQNDSFLFSNCPAGLQRSTQRRVARAIMQVYATDSHRPRRRRQRTS